MVVVDGKVGGILVAASEQWEKIRSRQVQIARIEIPGSPG